MITLVMLSGCINTVRFPPDLWGETTWWWTADTGFRTNVVAPSNGLQVQRVFGGCDNGESSLSYTVVTNGWADSAILTAMRQTDQRIEDHQMQLTDVDPGGAWDRWELGPLLPVPDPLLYEAGQNTGLNCVEDPDLAFSVRLIADAGRTRDCVMWGDELDPVLALDAHIRANDAFVFDAGGCRLIEL